jgi:rhodanese-related sulfurtransferase
MTSEATSLHVGEVLDLLGRDRPVERVLVFGALGSRVDGQYIAEIGSGEAPTVQLEHRYDLGVISAGAWEPSSTERRRALVHNLVAHLHPSARAVIEGTSASDAETLAHARACGLEPLPDGGSRMFRRTDRITVHDLVADARARLVRLTPAELAARLRSDCSCLVLDTRTRGDRDRFGKIPGSRHVPRSTLEWRVDPASGYSEEDVDDFGQCLVVVCNDGYSSSLAADSLQRLGFHNATDLRGGFRAWRDAGMLVVASERDRSAASET